MILAAGFGTRLLPYTKIRPKPLFPILNTPLLLLTVQRLQKAGFTRIVVNCHHLKEQIRDSLSTIDGVIVQEEKEILGTGGGLRRAIEHFDNEPLLVTNGDIYHLVDYKDLLVQHSQRDDLITLALHDYPRFNSIEVCGNNVLSFDSKKNDLLAFTGLHVIEPEVLLTIPQDRKSCIIECYRSLLNRGKSIGIERVDNRFWTDMGTIEDYLALHGGLIKGEIPRWKEIKGECTGDLFHDRESQYQSGLKVKDWACIGVVELGKNISLERSVVWDGVVVTSGTQLVDTLRVQGK